MVKTHFDESGALRSINGMTVPDLGRNVTAAVSARKAAQIAVNKVNGELKPKVLASSTGTGLFVYQQGLTKGVDLGTHLVWQVVVENKTNVKEYVFIDAQTGKFVDQITGIEDGLYRRAYDGANLPTVPPSYPNSPYWVEGQPFPTASFEAICPTGPDRGSSSSTLTSGRAALTATNPGFSIWIVLPSRFRKALSCLC
jgi:bacillolysin